MTPRLQGLRDRLTLAPIIGTFVGLASPAVVEILGWNGFDLLCLDAEHSAFGVAEIESLIRASDVVGAAALVRVSELGSEIGRALDWGADGVVVPRIETAAQAREAVERVRYPQVGSRGAGPGRATRYGAEMPAYLARANAGMLLVLQVETAAGVENVAEIAAVDGVDVIFVGPGDLGVSLGVAPGSVEHTKAVDAIIAAADARGVLTGIYCDSAEQVAHYAGRGVKLFLLGADVVFLAQAAALSLQAALAAVAAVTNKESI